MTNPVIDRIERELKKVFRDLNQRNWVKVSFILFKIDLSRFNKENYRFTFKFDSILKLYLFKKLKRFYRYDELTEYLQNHKQQAFDLGFLQNENNNLILPKKRTFNDYINKRLDTNHKDLLRYIYRRIVSSNLKLDIKEIKKPQKRSKKDLRKQFKEATKLVKKLVYPQIDIKIKENGKFTTRDLLDVLVHLAQTHDFCNNGSVTFKELNPEIKAPHGNTLLYHFRKLRSIDQLKTTFETVFDVIWNFAKRNYKELQRRKLDIAIDIHPIPYYGNKNDPFVMEGKKERGTNHFFKFMTCSIVVAGKRFTIDAVPMHNFDNIENLVEQLIKRAQSKIHIDKVYLDREFDKPKVINVLKKNRIRFIMPKIRSATVKSWMDKSEGCQSRIIENFEIGKHKDKALVNLILVQDEQGIQRAFITNFHIPEQLTHYLYRWYSKRWGIETGYRNMDHDFKPRTTSKNYHIRLFYFLFTVCLYNLWVLVNICVSLTLYGRVLTRPIVTAKLFSIILYKVQITYIDPGG